MSELPLQLYFPTCVVVNQFLRDVVHAEFLAAYYFQTEKEWDVCCDKGHHFLYEAIIRRGYTTRESPHTGVATAGEAEDTV